MSSPSARSGARSARLRTPGRSQTGSGPLARFLPGVDLLNRLAEERTQRAIASGNIAPDQYQVPVDGRAQGVERGFGIEWTTRHRALMRAEGMGLNLGG